MPPILNQLRNFMNSFKSSSMRASFFLSLVASAGTAFGGTISTTISPAGSIPLGSTFTVTFNMSGYTGTDEIDGYNFRGSYTSSLFSFVAASGDVNDGAAFGVDENWLRKAPQDLVGAGAIGLTDSTTTGAGVANISVVDLRGTSTRGTTAGSGFLYSFDLMADAIGTGSITPSAFPDGSTLYDVFLSPVGAPTFVGASVTVIPEPTTGLLAAAFALLCGRRRRRG
ncbi:MAG: hypothetical protein ACKV19_00795 [Verrucomicrobiales bacterium]